jgi:structure-specific recognition protein 1
MDNTCVKGINILTENEIREHGMRLKYKEKKVFDIDFEKVSNVNVIRNDLVLEMNSDDVRKHGLSLAEVRFFVPNRQKEGESSSADLLRQEIKQYIKDDENLQEKIYEFSELPFLVPRGKYDLAVYPNFFKLHGHTYNYNIKYANINKCFLLPMPDKTNLVFVMGYKKPILQGRTHYNYMLIQFNLKHEANVDAFIQGAKLKTYDENLLDKYSGILYEAFTSVFQIISKNPIILPDPDFKTSKDTNGIPCSVKAHQGVLFILKKSLMYLHKPSIYHFKYSNILTIYLHRFNDGTISKGFDIEIDTKKGQKVLFSNIPMSESDNLIEMLKSNNVKVEKANVNEDMSQDDYDDELEGISQDKEEERINDGFVQSDGESSEDDDFDPEKYKSDVKKKLMEEE